MKDFIVLVILVSGFVHSSTTLDEKDENEFIFQDGNLELLQDAKRIIMDKVQDDHDNDVALTNDDSEAGSKSDVNEKEIENINDDEDSAAESGSGGGSGDWKTFGSGSDNEEWESSGSGAFSDDDDYQYNPYKRPYGGSETSVKVDNGENAEEKGIKKEDVEDKNEGVEDNDGSELKVETGEDICSDQYAAKCTAPLDAIDSFAEISEEFCQNRNSIFECLHNIFRSCGDDGKTEDFESLKKLKEELNILCKSKESSSNPLACLERHEIMGPKSAECAILTKKEILSNNHLIESNDLKPEDLKCIAAHFMIECLTEVVTEICGEDTAELLEISLKAELEKTNKANSSPFCHSDENELESDEHEIESGEHDIQSGEHENSV